MCYGEECGMGGDVFAVVWRGGICGLWVVVFVLGGYAQASHTPSPSLRGEIVMLVFCCR